MKYPALFAAMLAMAAPAYGQTVSGPDCSNSVRLDHADVARGGVIVITGPCAASGPAREVIHTARPGEPMVTTVVIRRPDTASASQARVISVAERQDFDANSAARIIRLR